jgi:methyl-accepting chemotaxis protein
MAAESSQVKKSQIGIIGGGKAGLQLLQIFLNSQLAQIAYVVDREPNAPAIAAARAAGIATFADCLDALKAQTVDYIFEVTGSVHVVENLRAGMANVATQLITHDVTALLLRTIEDNRQATNQLVRTDIVEIKQGIVGSLATMAEAINGIKETTSDLRYLALNARIEAARAGEQGRGFDIVAQQVERSAEAVRSMTQEIAQVNANIASTSERIEASLQKLA